MNHPDRDLRVEADTGWRSHFAGIGQACLLLAVAASPAWSNGFSSYVYQPDKTWLLVILVSAGLIASIIGNRYHVAAKQRHQRQWPLAICLLILLLTMLASTIASIQPAWAWWGSPHRAWGTLQLLTLLAIAGIIALNFRHAKSRRQLIQAIILSSVPVVLVGIWQRLGTSAARPTSTLGNPSFLGSYLLFAGTFTVAEIAIQWQTRRQAGRRGSIATGALLILLALQLTLFIWSQARGAWLGIAGGLLFAAFIHALQKRQFRVAFCIAICLLISLIGIVATVLLVQADVPIGNTSFGYMFDLTGSGRQRLQVWDQLGRYLAEGNLTPARWLIGHGSDTQGLILPNQLPYRTPAGEADSPILLDRAHNVLLDELLSFGVIGLLARWLLGMIVIQAGLRQIELPTSLLHLLIGSAAGMAVMCIPLFLWSGQFELLPLTLSLGATAGLIAAITMTARPAAIANQPAASRIMALAALSALHAHWIDLQFGFETQSAGLLTWIAASILIFPINQSSRTDIKTPAARHISLASSAILIALLLGNGMQTGGLPAYLIGAIWLLCGILCGLWSSQREWARYPVFSLGPMVIVWMTARVAGMIPGNHGAWTAPAITMAAWAGVALSVYLAGKNDVSTKPPQSTSQKALTVLCTALLFLPGWILVAGPNMGDVAIRQAGVMARGGQVNDAIALAQRALSRGPYHAPAYDILAQIELGIARDSASPEKREDAMARAADAMRQAWDDSPLQTEFGRRLAQIYHEWADMSVDAEQRQVRLSHAADALTGALALAPADQQIAHELNIVRQLLAEGEAQ